MPPCVVFPLTPDDGPLFASFDGLRLAEIEQPATTPKVIAMSASDGFVSVVWRRPPDIRSGLSSAPPDLLEVLFLRTTDAGGQAPARIKTSAPPARVSALGAFGPRALAMDVNQERLWETLDAGQTWVERPLPGGVFSTRHRCSEIHCSAASCVLGTSLTRVGWGFDPLQEHELPRPPRKARPTVQAELQCEPGEVLARMPGMPAAPLVSDVGEVRWAQSMHEWRSHVLRRYVADRAGRIEEQLVFNAAPAATTMRVDQNAWGVAAVRHTVESGRLRGPLELAWGAAGATRLQVQRLEMPDGADSLFPVAAEGGAYLAAGEETVFYFDGQRVTSVRIPEVKKWPFSTRWRTLLSRDGQHFSFTYDGEVLQRRGERGPLVLLRIATRGQNYGFQHVAQLSVWGGRPFVQLTAFDAAPEARLFPLETTGPSLGAPIPVPATMPPSGELHPCTESERASTPRVAVDGRGATVRVRINKTLYGTSGVVLHGTPAAPCVASLALRHDKQSAFVSPEGPSYHFTQQRGHIEVRALNCRMD